MRDIQAIILLLYSIIFGSIGISFNSFWSEYPPACAVFYSLLTAIVTLTLKDKEQSCTH
jgi:hypothetical protein